MGEPLAALPPDGVDPPVAAADELELLEPQAARASAKNTAPIKNPTRIRRLGAAKLHFISIVPLRTSLGFAGLMNALVSHEQGGRWTMDDGIRSPVFRQRRTRTPRGSLELLDSPAWWRVVGMLSQSGLCRPSDPLFGYARSPVRRGCQNVTGHRRRPRLASTDPDDEWRRDAWDTLAVGKPQAYQVDFTSISQPWLRELNKQ
jgi:hypothetical protein